VQLGRWQDTFRGADPVGGRLTGLQARRLLLASRLPNSVLCKVTRHLAADVLQVWALADTDRDGQLDEEEFCLAM
jgi:EH domain-containing protein 4